MQGATQGRAEHVDVGQSRAHRRWEEPSTSTMGRVSLVFTSSPSAVKSSCTCGKQSQVGDWACVCSCGGCARSCTQRRIDTGEEQLASLRVPSPCSIDRSQRSERSEQKTGSAQTNDPATGAQKTWAIQTQRPDELRRQSVDEQRRKGYSCRARSCNHGKRNEQSKQIP